MSYDTPGVLTPNLLLRKVKRKLGVTALKIPLSDEELLDILYDETLPIFSIYFPAELPYKIDLGHCRQDNTLVSNEFQKAFHLDLPHSVKVLEIDSVEFFNSVCNNYWTPPLGALDSYELFNGQIMQGMVDSMMSTPVMHQFIEPDVLIIDDYGYSTTSVVTLKLLVVHGKDLSTIRFTYLEKLSRLFTLDVKMTLYEVMKHSDKIDTTVNQIDLKIDNWENAAQDREDLLEKWDNEFLAHRSNTIRRV